ncbi:GNAT family N-acetyltransferase [Rubrivivax gelatinosus]|nr:GNAT family N-acetyltransferase [Rubrivivax gelatinosus]
MTITLRPITAENFEDVASLPLLAHQHAYLASNSYSIAQASFFPFLVTRAIYLNERPIGFMMYAKPEPHEDQGEFGIWRFMVSSDHQGKGYGRQALARLISEIRSHPDVKRIFISYKPENEPAKIFYASFGFRETEVDDEGEMVAVLSCGEESTNGS